eukprot:TRINITY_DN2506_c0_g1_i5.p1 TRINITY_DN2506_c0_g1~~TRINITY_DN2506_c0_g1_i5.p1  ORF type:complete len:198 (+),score=32.62 TRINITY_DN2506_c0_g1_i5:1105-1698(+)
MVMKLRWHELSMPSRAVAWYLQYIGQECELVSVKVFEGEQKSEEYTAKHPMGQFPALEEGDFYLSESSAILQYLAEGRPELPTDRLERAKLEEYITEHHTTVRFLSSECFAQCAYVKENSTATKEEREPILAYRVPIITFILKHYEYVLGQQDYICGKKLTIADFLFCCEVCGCRYLGIESNCNNNISKTHTQTPSA